MRLDAPIRAHREAEGAEDITVQAPLALPVSWVIVDMRPGIALLLERLPASVGLLGDRGAEREREVQHKLAELDRVALCLTPPPSRLHHAHCASLPTGHLIARDLDARAVH